MERRYMNIATGSIDTRDGWLEAISGDKKELEALDKEEVERIGKTWILSLSAEDCFAEMEGSDLIEVE